MNALTPIVTERSSWVTALAAVRDWRGQAIHHFTVAEAAVTETLLVLADVPDRGAQVRLRHLVGQRFADLAAAIGPGGPFEPEGAAAAAALAAFAPHESLRTTLCHGRAKVWTDAYGDWLVTFEMLALRNRTGVRDTVLYDSARAAAALAGLKADTQTLTAALGLLRKALRG